MYCLGAGRRGGNNHCTGRNETFTCNAKGLIELEQSLCKFRGVMSRKNENWLLVEWSSGGREVVHVNSVLNPSVEELKVGVLMTLPRRGERESQTATLIARARNQDRLRSKSKEEAAGPSPKPDEEPGDYSPSGSSWAPSDDDSGDSDHDSRKKIKLENCTRQYINRRSSKKIITPSHRAKPVIPKIMQNALSKKELSRKRAHNGDNRNASFNKSLPDSTKRNNTSEVIEQTVTIDARELANISNSFRVLFRMIEELKRPMTQTDNPTRIQVYESTENISQVNETVVQAVGECEEAEEYENEEFNRSDDNVLITNKYDKRYNGSVTNMTVPVSNQSKAPGKAVQGANTGDSEWVPIGSGKTLIHVDQFRKVNWKSYTVATRTLLLAVFPRRILATHCLTGKKSPAFLNKPAKMCLDPKIISDVIMEIMDRFDVKENLVRGIITTKCADECKMLKQRAQKKSSQSRSSSKSSNQENEPPTKRNHVAAQ